MVIFFSQETTALKQNSFLFFQLPVFTCDAHQLAILRPEHELGCYLDASYEIGGLPVVEGEATHGAHAHQLTTKDVFGAEARLEGFPLLEVLEYLDLTAVADGVLRRVVGPDELLGRSVGFVAQRHRCIDDILAVAAHYHEAAIGVMQNGLRVDVAGAHVFDTEREFFAVFELLVDGESTQVGLLYFRVFGPDDFSARVHGHGGLFTTKLFL